MRTYFLLFLCFISSTVFPLDIHDHGTTIEIDSEYGHFIINEPPLLDLLRCPAMQRLKGVRQYGSTFYARTEADYTRFEHSVGVFVLLRKFGANLTEQIAGLLHDASHTAFSHVTDRLFIFDHSLGAYQDAIHEWSLTSMGVTAILKRHNLDHACTQQTKKKLHALKQPYPDVCADRLEYNLKGGLYEGYLNKQDITGIIKDIHFDGTHWYFDHVHHAKKLATVSLKLCDTIWGNHWHNFVYHCTANALKHALVIDLITTDDIHFSTDDIVWNKIKNSNDPLLQTYVYEIENFKDSYTLGNKEHHDLHTHGKFSGIDPLIKVNNAFVRLSACDAEFKKEHTRVKTKVKNGHYILFTNATVPTVEAISA